jgi:group I intron endonuclease
MDLDRRIVISEMVEAFTFPEDISDKYNEHQTVVYRAENNSGDYYIGATIRKDKRLREHIVSLQNNKHGRKGNDLFQKAYNNDSSFIFTTIPVIDEETAYAIEKILIDECRGDAMCLNMHGSVSFSAEHRNKIAIATMEYFKDPAAREKQSQLHTGKKLSQVTKDKISSSNMGRVCSEVTRNKISESQKNVPKSPEHTESIRNRVLENAKRVLIDGISYPSLASAGIVYNLTYRAIAYRINSPNFPNWVFE